MLFVQLAGKIGDCDTLKISAYGDLVGQSKVAKGTAINVYQMSPIIDDSEVYLKLYREFK